MKFLMLLFCLGIYSTAAQAQEILVVTEDLQTGPNSLSNFVLADNTLKTYCYISHEKSKALSPIKKDSQFKITSFKMLETPGFHNIPLEFTFLIIKYFNEVDYLPIYRQHYDSKVIDLPSSRPKQKFINELGIASPKDFGPGPYFSAKVSLESLENNETIQMECTDLSKIAFDKGILLTYLERSGKLKPKE